MIVPGAVAATAASIQAVSWGWAAGVHAPFWTLVSELWISRALGILAVVPPLLVVATPHLVRHRFTDPEPLSKLPGGNEPQDWTWGEMIEVGGLSLGAGILALVLVSLHIQQTLPGWTLWGFSLLLVVWASLRQGLHGGSLTAGASASRH